MSKKVEKVKACKKLPNTATKAERVAAHKAKMSLKACRRQALNRDFQDMIARGQMKPIKPNLSARHPNAMKPVQEAYK